MKNRSNRTAAKRAKAPDQRPKKSRRAKDDIGALPEWDLSDLYSGLDSPEITNDLARSDAQCLAFEERYKGKLAVLAGGPEGGRALAAAVRELEACLLYTSPSPRDS